MHNANTVYSTMSNCTCKHQHALYNQLFSILWWYFLTVRGEDKEVWSKGLLRKVDDIRLKYPHYENFSDLTEGLLRISSEDIALLKVRNTKAGFRQVKFFNGHESNYILKTSFWPTIYVNIKVKIFFHLHLVMSRIYL